MRHALIRNELVRQPLGTQRVELNLYGAMSAEPDVCLKFTGHVFCRDFHAGGRQITATHLTPVFHQVKPVVDRRAVVHAGNTATLLLVDVVLVIALRIGGDDFLNRHVVKPRVPDQVTEHLGRDDMALEYPDAVFNGRRVVVWVDIEHAWRVEPRYCFLVLRQFVFTVYRSPARRARHLDNRTLQNACAEDAHFQDEHLEQMLVASVQQLVLDASRHFLGGFFRQKIREEFNLFAA